MSGDITLPYSPKFLTVYAESVRSLQALSSLLNGWAFRGQSNSNWQLVPTLERAIGNASLSNSVTIEHAIHRAFIRRAHHLLEHPPSYNDLFEWFSLIQHYGGPTRLLDFTRSFYVASFFAINPESKDESAVWAVNLRHLAISFLKNTDVPTWEKGDFIHDLNPRIWGEYDSGKDKRILETIEEIKTEINNIKNKEKTHSTVTGLLHGPIKIDRWLMTRASNYNLKIVIPAEPSRISERMAAQQGLFLIASTTNEKFINLLSKTLGFKKFFWKDRLIKTLRGVPRNIDMYHDASIIKVIIPLTIKAQIREELRKMNINYATLFPDLTGYARSLYDYVDTIR